MTLREAAQQALEALGSSLYPQPRQMAAIAALRAALAEPVQEPYAWMAVGGSIWRHKTSEDDAPLFTAPPQRKPLTDDQITAINASLKIGTTTELVRAVERAHGIGGSGGGVA